MARTYPASKTRNAFHTPQMVPARTKSHAMFSCTTTASTVSTAASMPGGTRVPSRCQCAWPTRRSHARVRCYSALRFGRTPRPTGAASNTVTPALCLASASAADNPVKAAPAITTSVRPTAGPRAERSNAGAVSSQYDSSSITFSAPARLQGAYITLRDRRARAGRSNP